MAAHGESKTGMQSAQLDSFINEQWARVRGRLRAEVGEAAFRSWLKPLTLVGAKDGVVRMAVPTRFMRDWVRSNYVERIFALWGDENDIVREVEIIERYGKKFNSVGHHCLGADVRDQQFQQPA